MGVCQITITAYDTVQTVNLAIIIYKSQDQLALCIHGKKSIDTVCENLQFLCVLRILYAECLHLIHSSLISIIGGSPLCLISHCRDRCHRCCHRRCKRQCKCFVFSHNLLLSLPKGCPLLPNYKKEQRKSRSCVITIDYPLLLFFVV